MSCLQAVDREADDSLKREQLWHEYMDKYYAADFFGRSNQQNQATRSQDIKELKAWGEQFRADRDWILDLVERFCSYGVVPRPMFDELAESRPGYMRDKRYRMRLFRRTPSSIARKFACAIAGLSVSSVSHKHRRI